MNFVITAITSTNRGSSRRWNGLIGLDGHPGHAALEVDFHAGLSQITVSALGGIAFGSSPLPTQEYRAILDGAEPIFPCWEQMQPYVQAELQGLARRSTFREVAVALGWPAPADPNPTVRATVSVGDDLVWQADLALCDLAETIQDPSVRSITLARVPPESPHGPGRRSIAGIADPGMRVGYADAYLALHAPGSGPDDALARRSGAIQAITRYNADLAIVADGAPAAVEVADVAWDDQPDLTARHRLGHLAQVSRAIDPDHP